MEDKFSLAPKEIYQEAMNLATTALQARQAFWNALISLNGIIIAAAAIISASQYSSTMLLSIVLPAICPIILVGWNFFVLDRALDKAHSVFMGSEIDDNGHMIESSAHQDTAQRFEALRKWCKIRAYLAIFFTVLALFWVITVPVLANGKVFRFFK